MKTIDLIQFESLSPEKLLEISNFLKTIANPVRLNIILALIQKEECTIGELNKRVNVEQSLLSHHISNLRNNGIISTRKEGRRIYCKMENKSVLKVLNCLNNCSYSAK